jgi:biopolymer transport protein ExbB
MLWAIAKGGPVMIPIIIGSVLGLAIIIDRLWLLFRLRMDAASFTGKVFGALEMGEFERALKVCAKNAGHPLAMVMKAGIEKRNLPPHDLEKILERLGNSHVKSLERYIGGLISIIGIEPLLGFLGTITGLIRAFMAWERAGSNITVSALASGIYEAMITTAAGLTVAVPYYLICNFIISRVKYISYELADSSMRLIEILSEVKKKA